MRVSSSTRYSIVHLMSLNIKNSRRLYMKKIFVSSTFRDMNAERDIIHRVVMPRLNKIAREYGESISFCDLRWGVDTSDLDNDDGAKKVLEVCLNEIDKCKPYLIVLLGQRYGWIPDESLINAAAIKKNFILSDKKKNISVTELEIRYGAFNNLDHTLFYFRSINGEIPRNYQNNYISDENADKLITLKKDIESLEKNDATVVKSDYVLSWDNEKNRLDIGLEKFADMLVKDISNLMKAEWEERKTWSDYKRDRYLQWDFAEQKSIQYIDHDNLLSSCMEAVNDNEITAIKGTTGSGKSTLMSRLAIIFKEQGWHVLPIFSGLTTKTTTTVDVIRYIIDYIEDELSISLLQKELPKVEDWIDTLEVALNNWNEETKKRRLIILIDAVDQLHNDSYRKELRFIPPNLSSKVKMAFSCLDDFEIVQDIGSVVMPTINDDSKKNVINGMLQLYGKQLSNDVVKAICKKSASNNPLYLSFIVQRLNMMNQNDYENIAFRGDEMQSTNTKNCQMQAIDNQQMKILNKCPDDVESFCTYLINSAVDMLGADFVKIAVNYIAVSRYGIREYDLESILSHSMIKWDSLKFSLFINYLDNFFIQREDGRYDFAHKNIRIGCKKMVDDDVRLHQDILLYMKGLDFNDPIRQQEFVFHCMMADDKDAFVKYISELKSHINEETDNVRELAANAMNYTSLNYNETWIDDLLSHINVKDKSKENASYNSVITKLIRFFTSNIGKSKDTLDKSIIFDINDVLCMIEFFSKINFSCCNTSQEICYALNILHSNIALVDKILARWTSPFVQKLRADSYLNLGTVYLQTANMFDLRNAELAREQFQEACDVYVSMVECNNDIQDKVQLAKIYGKIATTYLPTVNILSNDVEDVIEKAITIMNDVISEQNNEKNISILSECIAMRNMLPFYNELIRGHIRLGYNVFDGEISKIEDALDRLNTKSNKHPDVNIDDSRIRIYGILAHIYQWQNPNNAIILCKKSQEILNKNKMYYSALNYNKKITNIYQILSTSYEHLGNIDDAIYYRKKCIDIQEGFLSLSSHHSTTILAGLMFDRAKMGVILSYKHHYDESRAYLEKVIEHLPSEVSNVFTVFIYDGLVLICNEEISEIDKEIDNTTDTSKIDCLKKRRKYIVSLEEYYAELMTKCPGCNDYLAWQEKNNKTFTGLMIPR